MNRRGAPVITVLDARPMSETGFRCTPPVSPAETSPKPQRDSNENGHVSKPEVSAIQRTGTAPKRPGPPSRPPSIHQSQAQSNTVNQSKPQSATCPEAETVDVTSKQNHLPSPAPRTTRPPPEGAESVNPTVDSKRAFPDAPEMCQTRKPPLGGAPPPLPSKSPSMGNLTMVGVSPTSSKEAAQPTPKPRPTPVPRKSVYRDSASLENVSVVAAPDSETSASQSSQTQPPPSQTRKPTIIRASSARSGINRTSVVTNTEPQSNQVTDTNGGPSPSAGSFFGVKLKRTVARDDVEKEENEGEKAASKTEKPVEETAAAADAENSASSSHQGWSSTADKKPPPVKPKPALLPKPALKPKPGSVRVKSVVITDATETTSLARRKSFHDAPSSNKPSTGKEDEPASAAAAATVSPASWMPKLKPTVLPKKERTQDELRPHVSHDEGKKPGPSPVKATYRPTIIRASATKQPRTQEKEQKDNRDEDEERKRASGWQQNELKDETKNMRHITQPAKTETDKAEHPPVKKQQPPTKRKPTIIRPKSVVKEDAVVKDEPQAQVPSQKASQPMRGAMSMPNIAQNTLSVAPPVGSLHKSPSQEELENHANEHKETNPVDEQRKKQRQVDTSPAAAETSVPTKTAAEDDMDVPFPINYDAKPMTKKVPPAKPPPPRPSSGPRKSQLLSTSDENVSSKQSPPLRPSSAPAKPKRSRPLSMPPGHSHHLPATMPPKLPGRPGPGHPLYHYMVSSPRGVALFDYTASQQDELTVKTGDVVELLKWVDDEWIYGKSASKEGILPLAFLDVIEPLPKNAQHYDAGNSHKHGPAASSDIPDAGHQMSGPHCVARFDYEGEEAGDLSFSIGDVIKLLERLGDDWLKGELKGKTGIFPVEFVQIVVDLPGSDQTGSVTSLGSTESDTSSLSTAMYVFSGEPHELSFETGDKIRVLGRVNEDWLYGELAGKRGSFPAGFVDRIPGNLPDHKEESGAHAHISQPAPSARKEQAAKHNEAVKICIANYPFTGENPEDLSFEQGDKILLIRDEGGDWLRGSLAGREGIFPKGFVTVVEDDGTARRLSSVSSERSGGSTPSLPSADQQVPYAEATFDFSGEVEGDLNFKVGDRIELISSQDEWLTGRVHGKEGLFPASFVQIIVPLPGH